MKRLGDRSLARALGLRARALRTTLQAEAWSDDEVQLAVAGLYGARLLTWSRAEMPFDRETIAKLFELGAGWLDRTVRRALDARAPVALVQAVDEVITLLAAARSEDREASSSGCLLSFYEPFLQSFDPELRRAKGAYFTPPVLAAHVVERVDAALEHELHVAGGISSAESSDERSVSAVDPAAGVGAFLSAWIERVHARVLRECRQRGLSARETDDAWQAYVPKHLLPRTIGFELMPVAHALSLLQVRLVLAATGYQLQPSDRIEVHRVDALALLEGLDEACASDDASLSAARSALRRANVIIGNPPYARGGAIRDEFWRELLDAYKKPVRAEKNLQPLADDYLRFLRFTDYLLERKPMAVAGLITNSTFLSGHLHRGVRERLAQTFARIDVLDLGGSSKRSSRDAARERDENVFGVAQGIAFTLLRRGPGLSPAPLRFSQLRGRRRDKLATLDDTAALELVTTVETTPTPPSFLFVPTREVPPEYESFMRLDQLFDWSSIAAKPGDDTLLVGLDPERLVADLTAFREATRTDPSLARTEAARRIRDFSGAIDAANVVRYAYRPFDTRFVYDDAHLWTRPVRRLRARIDGEPMLLTTRIAQDGKFAHVFATDRMPDVIFLSNKSSVNTFAFPRTALRVDAASSAFGFAVDRTALFDYVYALLHAKSYRERYAEALSHDFARIPLVRDRVLFEHLASAGGELLALHLGTSPLHAAARPRLVAERDRRIDSRSVSLQREIVDAHGRLRIAINASSHFEDVSVRAWQLRVGGYQVCHKWLLDRARAGMSFDEPLAEQFADVVARAEETWRLAELVERHIARAGGFPGVCGG